MPFLYSHAIMIKKTKLKEVPETEVSDGVLNMLATTGNSALRSAQQSVDNYTSRVSSMQRNVASRRSEINNQYRRILEDKESEKAYKRSLKTAKATLDGIDTKEIEETAQNNIDMAKKLRYVESITVATNSTSIITVKTRLIFTDIRKESGSRSYLRRCLGAFTFTFNMTDQTVRVSNTLFPNTNEHWAIRGGEPCRGEHNDRFVDAFRKGDLFMLLETMFHFLRSTDDGGAYEGSHHWVQNRDDAYKGTTRTQALRKGNYVFVHSDYDQYKSEEHGNYAQIMRVYQGSLYLQFKEPFEYGHTMRGLVPEGTGYRVLITGVQKILKKEFDEESLTIEAVRNKNPLDAIDALPEGSTLSEAKNLF